MSEEDYPEGYRVTTKADLDAQWRQQTEVGDAVQLMERRLRDFVPTGRTREPKRVIVIEGVARAETLREKLERQREELAGAIAALTTQIAKREAQLRELDRYPVEDPYRDGDALEFRKKYPSSDERYLFHAVRVNGLWYTTGHRGPNGVPWAKFTEWLGLGVTDVYKIGRTRKTPVSW